MVSRRLGVVPQKDFSDRTENLQRGLALDVVVLAKRSNTFVTRSVAASWRYRRSSVLRTEDVDTGHDLGEIDVMLSQSTVTSNGALPPVLGSEKSLTWFT